MQVIGFTFDLEESRATGAPSVSLREEEADGRSALRRDEEQRLIELAGRAASLDYPLFWSLVVPLAKSGRCLVAITSDAPAVPLVVDTGGSYRPVLVATDEEDGTHVRVGAALHRNGINVDMERVDLLLRDHGVAFVGGKALHVERGGAAQDGIDALVARGPLRFPTEDAPAALRELWEDVRGEMVLPASYARVDARKARLRTHVIVRSALQGAGKKSASLPADVVFDYEGMRASWSDPSDVVVDFAGRRLARRSRGREADALEELARSGFRVRVSPERGERGYVVPASRLTAAITMLSPDRFVVEADGLRMRTAATWKASVTSGIDWFDVSLGLSFDGVPATVPAILDAIRRSDGLVRLGVDGTGILPAAWLDKLRHMTGLAGVEKSGADEPARLRFKPAQLALVDALLEEQASVSWDAPMKALRAKLHEGPPRAESFTPPPSFRGTLRDYQREGVAWMQWLEELGFSGCLADDMGLGKTVQVIAFLLARKEAGRASGTSLVVAPRSVVHNWIDETRRFAPSLRVLEHRTGRPANVYAGADLVVTTYGLMRHDFATLREMDLDVVILDEAHAVKNRESATSLAARSLPSRGRLALTGTPVENGLDDLAALFDFLNPGMLGPSVKSLVRAGFDVKANEVERLGRGLAPFLLRRQKSDVLRELPARIEQTLAIELGPEQRRIYDRVRDHFRRSLARRIDARGLPKARFHVLEAILRLRQLACDPRLLDPASRAGSAKIDALVEQLGPVVAAGKKALVFSQFTKLLDLVEIELGDAGIRFARLDGSTGDRKGTVARFQEDPRCSVFLVSLKAGGVGLNLTAAEVVFLLDPWWNPAVEAQAIDRAHRLGQKNDVIAVRLACKDTIEDRVAELQAKKRLLAQELFGGHGSAKLAGLAREDIDALLS